MQRDVWYNVGILVIGAAVGMTRSEQPGGVRGGSESARRQRHAQNCKHGKDCLFHCRISFVCLRSRQSLVGFAEFPTVRPALPSASIGYSGSIDRAANEAPLK